MNIGERVTAIRIANEGKVFIYGHGVYVGERVPPFNVSGFLHEAGIENPCIELDQGGEVYGVQCWWGPEDKVKERYQNWEFITVPVPVSEGS